MRRSRRDTLRTAVTATLAWLILGAAVTSVALAGTAMNQVEWLSDANHAPYCDRVRADRRIIDATRSRELVLVHLEGAGDADGDRVRITVTGVKQDERLTGRGDSTSPDAALADVPHGVHLRAERNRRGDGRVYFVRFRAEDGRGGSCRGVTTVGVPRWRWSGFALDSGLRVVSTAQRAVARDSRRGHRRSRPVRRSPR